MSGSSAFKQVMKKAGSFMMKKVGSSSESQAPQSQPQQPASPKNANYQSASGYRASYRSRRRHQQGLLGAGTDMES